MKPRQWIIATLLLLLVGAAVLGLVWTRDPGPVLDASGNPVAPRRWGRKVAPQREQLVDQRPLQTARSLAALASTPQEEAFVHEALRLADHEVDLAFADALRTATDKQPAPTPAVKQLLGLKAQAQAAVEADQQLIAKLGKQLAAAPENDSLQDQLDVAKAQLELDQDELDSASEDLERAGADPQAKIKRLIAAHEASDKAQPAAASAPAPERLLSAGSLLAKSKDLSALKAKLALLGEAQGQAQAKAQRLSQRHDELVKQVQKEKDDREAAKQKASGFARGGHADAATSKAAAKDALDSLKRYMADQRTLTDLGKRVQDEQDLATLYGDWMAVVGAQETQALHLVLQRVLWILLVVFVVYLVDRLIEHNFGGAEEGRKRTGTLGLVARFSLQAVGLLVIVFVVLGVPGQATTILGLAGAGLTVALKDFIVAFFGWFVLMGKNGIRVGDWVEIKGVGGEVVEIGLMRTVLLETGSWSDAGHPTGRRVAFVNSFATEGHYFNFSTSGQWMWDELSVAVPPGQDPYPVIDGIQKLVEQETSSSAEQAEQEWQNATTRYRVQAFSAKPGINVVPTSAGIEVRVRYITRAYERYEARKALYQSVLELLHGKRAEEQSGDKPEGGPEGGN